MIEATTLIADVKGDFEGGNSLSVDWDTLIRRAVKKVLENSKPDTLKRRVPIYGGFAKDLYVYYCPSDVLTPSDIYDAESIAFIGERKPAFVYKPPKAFYAQRDDKSFTIEYINGKRFIIARREISKASTTLELFDAVGTISGGTPTLNTFNHLFGSGAVQATFTDAGVEFGDTLDTAIDLTDYYQYGVAVVPVYISDVSKLSALELRLKTDNSNYYSVSLAGDSNSNQLVNGWNFLRFELANKSTTGSPTVTNIAKWSIVGTTTTGNTLTMIFDKITVQVSAPYFFEYFSSSPYISGSTGAYWQSTISYANNDQINLDYNELGDVLHYEMCMLVVQSATFDNVDGQASKRFEGQLRRSWQAYWAEHPSGQAPLSYNIAPEIDISQDIDFGHLQDNTDFEI